MKEDLKLSPERIVVITLRVMDPTPQAADAAAVRGEAIGFAYLPPPRGYMMRSGFRVQKCKMQNAKCKTQNGAVRSFSQGCALGYEITHLRCYGGPRPTRNVEAPAAEAQQ